MILWLLRKPRFVQAKASKELIREVTIVEFSDSGERVKTVHVPKVVKTEDEWRKQLSPGRFRNNPPRVGRASGRRSHPRTFALRETPASVSSGLQFHALNATRIWVTCSTMVQNLRILY